MKTDFTVAEEMHRRTNQSSIDSERNHAGSLNQQENLMQNKYH